MKEKAYMIPRKSRLFIAAAVCMSLQFVAITLVHMTYFDNHIPFFGNLAFFEYYFYFDDFPIRYFVSFLIDDILYFASLVLYVIGVFLTRKNLWVLGSGWICYLLVKLRQYFTTSDSELLSLVIGACALCAALVLILVQTGKIRSRKVAVIPFAVIGAVYLAIDLPSLLQDFDVVSFVSLLAFVIQPVSCALLMGAMLFKTDAVILPKPIVEEKADEEQFPQ